ncbi:Ig-like domain-containing protein [Vibrio vulnificus]|uniref:Ig-like domain-containing protein n=1 Tax=Vibrio vulnificus TaxID=672 RepID=UPI0037DAA3CA
MYRKTTTLASLMLTVGFALNPISAALAETVQIGVQAPSESQWWSTYRVQVSNAGDSQIEMRESNIEFVLPSAVNDVQWASEHLSYPSSAITHQPIQGGVRHIVTFQFPQEDWVKTTLQANQSFQLTIGYNGQLNDLARFEQSIKFNGDGGTLPPVDPEVELTILAPVEGATLTVSEPTSISISLSGPADKVEFWAENRRLGEQTVDENTQEYQQSWTPNTTGTQTVTALAFDQAGKQLESQSVSVSVIPDHQYSAPEVRFLTPQSGQSFKKTERIAIAVEAFDADDDLKSVTLDANGVEICQFEPAESTPFECEWQPVNAGSVTLSATAVDEQKLQSVAQVSISVTESSNSCGDVPRYQDGVNYHVGDQVTNVGEIFSCKVFGWCGNPVWAPGTGHPSYPDAWKDAWDQVGQCDPNYAPEVDLLSPSNGDRLTPNQPFDVVLTATDEDGDIEKVEVLLNGKVVATADGQQDVDAYRLTVAGQAEGMYQLTAMAYDDKGASSETSPITVAITDKTLVVGLTSPSDGSVFTQGRAITLTADASSFVGEVTQVRFYADDLLIATVTQSPYQHEWLGAQLGQHQLYAIATDSKGNEQTSVVSHIEVKEAKPDTGLRDNPDRSITYLTSWGLTNIEELQRSQGDAYFLSFGKWDSAGNIQISDDMLTPSYNSDWMSPTYQSWTELKHAQPRKAMMVAFGGATYESMWNDMATEQGRQNIANSLVKLMNQPYPVYKRNLKPEEMVGECLATDWSGQCDYSKYQLAGYVSIDGIDFDYETTARLTEQSNRNLEDLIQRIRAQVGDSKLLSLTTYHVGADPESCSNPAVYDDCSFIEPARSIHHGEVISLLQNTKQSIDFFNVMAYDAGENFRYDVAMANYAKHVGDPSKIILGATINSQWGPNGRFVETRENNIERARWQKQNGYGGFFIWTLGSNTESLSMAEQVDYFNQMIEQNQ